MRTRPRREIRIARRGWSARLVAVALLGCASCSGEIRGSSGDGGLPPPDGGFPPDAGPPPDGGAPPDAGACAEGAITGACACGGVAVSSGYCCASVWQATECFTGPLTDLVAPDRITTWNPGILTDGQAGQPLGADGLPQRTTVCATLAPGADIQGAIDACPAGQVVQLGAGTFTVSSTITLEKGVVLRGSGSQGAPAGTTIVKTGGETALAIGPDRDSTCYGGTGHPLAQDAPKGATTLAVGAAAASFSAGDLALIDVVDDSTIDQGDCPYFKREDGRSASQRVEIQAVDTAGGTLTLTSPLHWSFRAASPYAAQITRVTRPTTRWAGIEHVRL
ncbi:MAG TPA: hypothetical protein VGQ83_31670 [Polyangia bacterium]|jgi:hypothetical protein